MEESVDLHGLYMHGNSDSDFGWNLIFFQSVM